MLFGFAFILTLGHTYCVIFVIGVIVMLFNELLSLKRDKEREKPIPNFWLINWYFFFLVLSYLIPRFLPPETEVKLFSEPILNTLHAYSPLTLFGGFVAGILLFTLGLEKGMYRYQFKQFAWTFVTLIFVVG